MSDLPYNQNNPRPQKNLGITAANGLKLMPLLPEDDVDVPDLKLKEVWNQDTADQVQDHKGILAERINTADDPAQEAARVRAAQYIANVTGEDPGDIWENWDAVSESWFGKKVTPSDFLDRVTTTWDAAWKQLEIMNLRKKQLQGTGDWDAINDQVAEIKKSMPSADAMENLLPQMMKLNAARNKEDQVSLGKLIAGALISPLAPRLGVSTIIEQGKNIKTLYDEVKNDEGLLKRGILSAAGLLPLQLYAQAQGAKTGVAGMLGGAGAALLLGQAVPLPEELLTVPGAAAAGFKVGFTAGTIREMGLLEAGGSLDEIIDSINSLDLKDKDGNPVSVDPNIARAFASAVGAVNGALEFMEARTLLKASGLQNIVNKAFADTFTKQAYRRTIAKIITDKVKETGGYVGENTLQEVLQELTTATATQVADVVNARVKGTRYEADWSGLPDRLISTAETSALGFGAMHGPLALVTGSHEIVKSRSKAEQIKAAVQEAQEKKRDNQQAEKAGEIIQKAVVDNPAGESSTEDQTVIDTLANMNEKDRDEIIEAILDDEIEQDKHAARPWDISRHAVDDSPGATRQGENVSKVNETPENATEAFQDAHEKIKVSFPQYSDDAISVGLKMMERRAAAMGIDLPTFLDRFFQKEITTKAPVPDADPGSYTAGVTFLEDGKALIHATEQADFGSFIHEAGHVIRRTLSAAQDDAVREWLGFKGEWGTKDAEPYEEAFTEGLMAYIQDGIAPDPEVKSLFDQIVSFLQDTYSYLKEIIEIPQPMREAFDSMFTAQEENQDRKEAYAVDENEVDTTEPADAGMPLFMYVGEKATLSKDELQALKVAKKLEKRGRTPQEIREATGWIKNRFDYKWRKEIPDWSSRFNQKSLEMANHNKSQPGFSPRIAGYEWMLQDDGTVYIRLVHDEDSGDFYLFSGRTIDQLKGNIPETIRQEIKGKIASGERSGNENIADERPMFSKTSTDRYPLGEILDHEDLYAVHPQLKDLPVEYEDMHPGMSGGLEVSARTGEAKRIVLNNELTPAMAHETLVHEVQHAIQAIEGFAPGGTSDIPALMREVTHSIYEIEQKDEFIRFTAAKRELKVASLANTIKKLRKNPKSFRKSSDWHKRTPFSVPVTTSKEYLPFMKRMVDEYLLDEVAALDNEERVLLDVIMQQDESGTDKLENRIRRAERALQQTLPYARWYDQLVRLRDNPPQNSIDAHNVYQQIAGEIESRDVSARLEYDEEKLAEIFPYTTAKKYTHGYVLFDSVTMESSALPTYATIEGQDQVALDRAIGRLPQEHRERIRTNLERFKDTTWSKAAIAELLYTEKLVQLLDGIEEFDYRSPYDGNQNGLRKYIEKHGKDGIFHYLIENGAIGSAAKPVNTISGSFADCDPSPICAGACYTASGRGSWTNSLAKAVAVTYAVKNYPQKFAEIAAAQYKSTPEYYLDKALRLMDRGDLSPEWIPVIKHLNAQGIRVQVFSKRPDILAQVPEKNVRLLSIDATNTAKMDGNDLPVAYLYSGTGKDLEIMEQNKDRIQVILPIVKNGKVLSQSELDKLPGWTQKATCPIDAGIKTLSPKKTNPGWNCTQCDAEGQPGCFFGQVTSSLKEIETKQFERDELLDNLNNLREELEKRTDIDGETFRQLDRRLDRVATHIQAGTIRGSAEEILGLLVATDETGTPLLQRKETEYEREVRRSLAQGYPVPDYVLNEFSDRPWARAELEKRDSEALLPHDLQWIYDEARTFTSADEFIDYLDFLFDGENEFIQDKKTETGEYIRWAQAVYDTAHEELQDPHQANETFVREMDNLEAVKAYLENLAINVKKKTGASRILYAVALSGSPSERGLKAAQKILQQNPRKYRSIEAMLNRDQYALRQLEYEEQLEYLKDLKAKAKAEDDAFQKLKRQAIEDLDNLDGSLADFLTDERLKYEDLNKSYKESQRDVRKLEKQKKDLEQEIAGMNTRLARAGELNQGQTKEIKDLTRQIERAEKRHDKILTTYREKVHERDAKARRRKLMLHMARQIMKPVPKTVHYEQKLQIEAIQSTIDPHFRRIDLEKLFPEVEGLDIIEAMLERRFGKLPGKAKDRTPADFPEPFPNEPEGQGHGFDIPQNGEFRDGMLHFSIDPETWAKIPDRIKDLITKKNLNEFTVEELRELYDDVRKLIVEGREKLAGIEAERDANVERIVGGMQSAVVVYGKLKANSRADGIGSVLDKEKQRGDKKTKIEINTWNPIRVFERLDGGRQGVIVDTFWHEINKITDRTLKKTDERIDSLYAEMERLGITPETLQREITANGKTYMADEVMDIWVGYMNEMKKEALEHGNYINPKDAEALSAQLTKEEKALALYILKDYQEHYPRLRQAVLDYYNEDMGSQANYSPILRQEMDGLPLNEQLAKEIAIQHSVRKGYAEAGFRKRRIRIGRDHQKPIKLGMISTYLGQAERQEHFIQSAEHIRTMQRVMGDVYLRKAIRNNYGHYLTRYMEKYINDFANPQAFQVHTTLDRISRQLRSSMAMCYLSFNPVTMLKQLPSAALYVGYADPGTLVKNIATVMSPKGWKEAQDFVESRDPQVKHRSMDRIMEDIKNADEAGFWKITNKIGSTGMMGIAFMDKTAVLAGWKAVYETNLRQQEQEVEAGIRTEVSEEEAIRAAQDATLRTQPSGKAKDLAQIYRNGEIMSWLTVFSNQLNKLWGIATWDIPQAFRNAGAAGKEAKTLEAAGETDKADIQRRIRNRQLSFAWAQIGGYITAAYVIGVAGRLRLLPKDKKKVALDPIVQFISSIPLMGRDVVAALQGWNIGVSPWGFVEPFANAGRRIYKGPEKFDDWFKLALDLIDGTGVVTGLPGTETRRILKAAKQKDPWEIVGGRD